MKKEFQPGFGSLIVLKFPNTYFTEENIRFFRSFKTNIESIEHIFKVNSPLDATVIINQEDMLTIQTYDNALKEFNITSISDYETKFIDSPYYGKLLSNNHQWVGISSIN